MKELARSRSFQISTFVVQAGGQRSEIAIYQARPITGHAAVAIADWDGDGHWDILSGNDEWRACTWFRNVGETGTPHFEEAKEIDLPRIRVAGLRRNRWK